MKTVCLNPAYVLKPDEGRVLLLLKELIRYNSFVKNGTEFILHPIHAIILNFADGSDYDTVVNKASSFLKVNPLFVKKFISSLIDNDNYVEYHSKSLPSGYRLPPKVLVSSNITRNDIYDPHSFLTNSLDLKAKRHSTPTNLVLMVNNKCVTNCFYCYADRRKPINCQIPVNRIKQLIKEARELNVNTFNVIGGEFFLYSHWKEILEYLYSYNFNPYVSTKIPLSEKVIQDLALLKIKDLQISLDTLIPEHVCSILNVSPAYLERLKESFNLLEKYNIRITIHTILNSKNDTIEDLKTLVYFIKQYQNIIEWKVDTAAPSLYVTTPYQQIKPKDVNVDTIISFLTEIKENTKFRILLPRKRTYMFNDKEKNKLFQNRSVCSANYSGFFILPDGNVTICEELYWHKKFIIGNVLEQGLMDIWSSQKAFNLYNLSQNNIPNDSKCSRCSKFTSCRLGKGVCWKSVIQTYGENKWYYPDPLCPY